MNSQIRLVLAIHNHQPIGNFEGVFEEAYKDSYEPFLNILGDYPEIPIALHTSGSLMEWLVDAHPEYIDRVRAMVERGQIEIIGGPFFEPILACIPGRDRIGQIREYSRYLRKLFGTDIRGMWVPERVWEQSFTSDIVQGGIEYTVLDDFHFRSAGYRDDQLNGYYLTEDEGRLLKIFPGSEPLRYTIPFADPQETINYLRGIYEANPNAVITFGDDGEKFGTWPGTKDHVYRDGWLRMFLDSLMANREWLKVTTPGEAVDHTSPKDKCYIADSSYREMTEWALPTDRQRELHNLTETHKHDADWHVLKSYIKGGFWRNFRVKYEESNDMYCRMLEVSDRLEALSQETDASEHRDILAAAKTELYRAQCNCSYWHGAFGGLYLPHLRNAVYKSLIAADNLLEKCARRESGWVAIDVADYNRDARQEIRLSNGRLVAYTSPSRGGHLYELDIRDTQHNLLATLNRRPEPYHETIRNAADKQHDHHDSDSTVSIHDMVRFKQPDLDRKIVYDNWMRKSLVDHFLRPRLTVEEFKRGEGELSDFVNGVYEPAIRRAADFVELQLKRNGQLGPYDISVQKRIHLAAEQGSNLEITYELDNLPAKIPVHFGIEFNFAGMAAGQSDRYYYNGNGEQIGQLETVQELSETSRIGLVDEWLGLDVSLEISQPADIWTLPIETISQSEGGFELVHQSCAVVPHWHITLPEGGRWSVTIRMGIDTSAAAARQLAAATTV